MMKTFGKKTVKISQK